MWCAARLGSEIAQSEALMELEEVGKEVKTLCSDKNKNRLIAMIALISQMQQMLFNELFI